MERNKFEGYLAMMHCVKEFSARFLQKKEVQLNDVVLQIVELQCTSTL